MPPRRATNSLVQLALVASVAAGTSGCFESADYTLPECVNRESVSAEFDDLFAAAALPQYTARFDAEPALFMVRVEQSQTRPSDTLRYADHTHLMPRDKAAFLSGQHKGTLLEWSAGPQSGHRQSNFRTDPSLPDLAASGIRRGWRKDSDGRRALLQLERFERDNEGLITSIELWLDLDAAVAALGCEADL